MITNGTRVQWKSHTGKKRTGIYKFDFKTRNRSLVIGDFDGKPHEIMKHRLDPYKREDSDGENDTQE